MITKIRSVVMANLSPQTILSKVSREKCISNLKEMPKAIYSDQKTKKTAAVLVPLCVVDGEVSLLYTLRSSSLKNHSGQVSFPGGKSDENETLEDTALRETEEELGIPRDSIEVWGQMSAVQGRDKNLLITPVVGVVNDFDMDKLVPNVHEVDKVFTVTLEELCDPKNHGHLLFHNNPLPVFLNKGFKIWGITGFITQCFLQCLLPHKMENMDFMSRQYTMEELMPSKL